ncbi:phosphatidylserine decarboxylase [Westerdykella ornata]|uniref:phosphatidylserine decarboxylase n=1 Tax=Westerdykella ornata TaxID=318751 RepID=A0A6A6JLA2_WESOR|nr:phosphatidylserine decarboxylase [Westerdykella ornata]KAF2277005.1 phosphatidylserine decarboxylase [Westerdykella ornata]
MFRVILGWIHAILNWILLRLNLVSHHQVGWTSLNRKTGELEREQEPVMKKIKLAFLFSPFMEWLDRTHAFRMYVHNKTLKQGKAEARPSTHQQIKGFVDYYKINMNDFDPSDIEKYGSFEDFFVRKHREGTRPIAEPENPKRAIVCADSRVVTYDTVAESKKLWIKGTDFNMTNLVMDVNIGKRFENGAVASFRLSPQDYHRYHSPVNGVVKEFRSMPGEYYEVDPIAINSDINILTSNARDYILIDSREFGEVLFVAIGASEVGTVYRSIHEKYRKRGTEIKKGDELGIFQFGGSSIVVAFQQGRIKFDDDLRDCSTNRIQVAVEMGMSLGVATRYSQPNGPNAGLGASYADVVKEE